jgi:alpha-amylase
MRLFSALLLALPAAGLTNAELRERSIYQVITDRFARADGQTTPCDPAAKEYCGGGWKGIERQLGYIQGMGFDTGEYSTCRRCILTAVWISPVVANIPGVPGSSSYHGE